MGGEDVFGGGIVLDLAEMAEDDALNAEAGRVGGEDNVSYSGFNTLPTLDITDNYTANDHLVDYNMKTSHAIYVGERFLENLDRAFLKNSIIMSLYTFMRKLLFSGLLLLFEEMLICSSDSLPSDITVGFAVDLYHAIRSVQKNQNLICSPMSISLGLGMIELGARGTTLQQLRKGLHFDKAQEGKEFSMMKKQSKIISTDSKKYKLKLANAIYIQDGYRLSEQYLHSNREFFDNAVRKVNFLDSISAANIINTWVANHTNGKVKNLVSSQSFSPLTKLVLVNAIYFKGTWKHKFNSENTRLMEFIKQDGSVVEIAMMHQQVTSRFGYFSAGEMSYQVLEVPYSGDEASIILALPAEGTDLAELEKLITPQIIQNWLSTLTEEDIEINLPRFKIQQKLDLKEPFRVLNITEIFENGSDLSGITDSPDLHISEAVHQAFIEINEEGSEAAASTGMTAAIMSLPRHQFMANRPFVFLIWSNLTGSVLFVGRVMDPEMMNSYGRDKEAL
ncbi:serpin I2-like [Heptranchias perlo]|uniref:serpin I2-like n=1 Tax=Heptranchias perlo TaxID=212740 RepID=UPI00355A4069